MGTQGTLLGRVLIAAEALSLRPAAGAEEVNVFAAASLTDVLKEIAQGFEKETGHRVVLSLGGSSDLARQTRAGLALGRDGDGHDFKFIYAAEVARVACVDRQIVGKGRGRNHGVEGASLGLPA